MAQKDSAKAQGWRRNGYVLPISAVMLAVLIYAVPRNLPPDPVVLNVRFPRLDGSLAVAHVLLATVAITCVCVNIWPWLRTRYPAVHRRIGAVYVFSALAASLLTLPMVLLNNTWQADVGAAAGGTFWFVSTLIGYVGHRQGDRAKHRRWMLYSFAMATTIVYGVVLTPFLSSPEQFPYLLELVRWAGPLLNLAAVKWWLDRTARPVATVVPFRAPSRRDRPDRKIA